MDGKSMDIAGDKLNQLKAILPEAFTENKIDWEKLRAALGDNIEFKNERYVLNWAGKSDAFRALQAPSTATLSPCPEESVYFEQSGNVFIEGENLEVLKALQKSYFGKIKMIYIDPPYNTGNDHFIYPDRFSESREDYLSRIGDKDETGLMTREGLFRKNSKDGGHYHSNWLSMMYPRLFLARNLLRDDGVIFVSIDDNEVHNIRLLMNEVFGEENFVAQFVWKARKFSDTRSINNVSTDHEYLLSYSKIYEFSLRGAGRDESKFSNPDGDARGVWMSRSILGLATKDQRPNLHYDIVDPSTGKLFPPNAATGWRYSQSKMKELIIDGRILFPSKSNGRPREKKFRGEMKSEQISFRSLIEDTHTADGTKEMRSLFHAEIFAFPKPYTLIKNFVDQSTSKDNQDIILDFFAGSCTTAHAVLELNREDGGNRKFICVQLPEKCDENTEAYKAGYSTIAEIGKERIRRVIRKISDDQSGKLDLDGRAASQDLGFKVFKLRESNFKIWRTAIETEEDLVAQMQQHLEPLDEHAKIEDILYELLLKAGVPLTADIRAEEGFLLANNGEIALALERADEDVIKKILAMKPQKVFTLDRLFKQNDKLKTNTALQMKDAGIEFKVI